jgi:hypothetical protein
VFNVSQPYASRPIRFLGINEHAGYRIKLYSITHGDAPLDRATYDDCLPLALNDLPQPVATTHRPGVGFAIFHQGRGWHYLVLNWWDNENELPQRIWVRERDDPTARWRRADPNQSICVWDLQLIWFERETYVRHVLSPDGVSVNAYVIAAFNA